MKVEVSDIDAPMTRSRILGVALFFGFIWLCICLSAAIFEYPDAIFTAYYIGLLGLAIFRPIWGMCAFLIIMPWLGGGQPGDMHTVRFLISLAGLGIGMGLNFAWSCLSEMRRLHINWANPLVFALLVFWLVTALGIVGVPSHGVLRALVIPDSSLAFNLLDGTEAEESYPWLSFIILTLVLGLNLFLYELLRSIVVSRTLILQCLGIGALISVVVGILDYFDWISLVQVRPEGGNAFQYDRLVSLFGNPTWYAQFLVLSAPTILSVLYLRWRRSFVIGLMLLIVVITEFCILLINQRGGWLAYPLTLVVIWFCVYVLDSPDKISSSRTKILDGIKHSWFKIVVSLPLTLLVSFAIIFFVAGMNESGKKHVLGFFERAKTIQNVNDRLAYLEPTLKLLHRHPVLGTGVDSFQYQYEQAFMVAGHPCVHDDPNTTTSRGTAHNLYFQTLVGKGVVGLLSLIGIMFASIALAWRGVFQTDVNGSCVIDREQQIMIMAGFAFTLALMIYGNVGEIFYAPTNFVVFAVFYTLSALAGDGLLSLSLRVRWFIAALLGGAFALHLYLVNFVSLGC